MQRATLSLAVAALVAPLLLAAPAHARNTQRCHQGAPKVIKLPGQADIRVTEQTCVIKFPVGTDRAKFKAWVYTTWKPAGGGTVRPKLFEDYNVQARLELNQRGADRVLGTRTCKIAATINRAASGSYTCETNVEGNFGTAPRFTGDGTVVYDVDGDGKGNRRWPLQGSPRV